MNRPKSYNRYKIIVQDPDGQRWRDTTNPVIDTTTRSDDRFHIVLAGDRLDLLAHKYLADARLWWVIALFNDIIWFLDIEVGQELRIPSYERTMIEILV